MHRYVYFQDKTFSIHNAGIIRILWWELLVLCTFSIYNAQQKKAAGLQRSLPHVTLKFGPIYY